MNHTPAPFPVLLALVLGVALLLVPAGAAGQTTGSTELRACFVPGSGTVYMIGQDGAPDECRSPRHVEFSWLPLGHAGQTCPPGLFLTGFASDGSLLCAAAGGNDDTVPSGFAGVWSFAPPVTVACGDVAYNITGADVDDSTGGGLAFRLLNDLGFPLLVDADFDPTTWEFSGRLELDADNFLSLEGRFIATDRVEIRIFGSSTTAGVVCSFDATTVGTR